MNVSPKRLLTLSLLTLPITALFPVLWIWSVYGQTESLSHLGLMVVAMTVIGVLIFWSLWKSIYESSMVFMFNLVALAWMMMWPSHIYPQPTVVIEAQKVAQLTQSPYWMHQVRLWTWNPKTAKLHEQDIIQMAKSTPDPEGKSWILAQSLVKKGYVLPSNIQQELTEGLLTPQGRMVLVEQAQDYLAHHAEVTLDEEWIRNRFFQLPP